MCIRDRVLVDQNLEFYSGGAGQTLQQILSEQLVTAEQELEQARADYAEALAASPQNEATLSIASQALEVRERTYTSLLTQYEAARLDVYKRQGPD